MPRTAKSKIQGTLRGKPAGPPKFKKGPGRALKTGMVLDKSPLPGVKKKKGKKTPKHFGDTFDMGQM